MDEQILKQVNKIKQYFPVEVRKTILNKWERNYISSLLRLDKLFTDKQKQTINNIVIKYKLKPVQLKEKVIAPAIPVGYSYQKITSRQYRKNRSIGTKLK